MLSSLTYQLRLVEKHSISHFLPLGFSLSPLGGISQEIFRNGEHIGSVSPLDKNSLSSSQRKDQVKVHNGDVIVHVSMLPLTYTIVGTLATKDKYKRIYELPVTLSVSDPVHIARSWYLLNQDPARGALEYFKRMYEQYAEGVEYDRIVTMTPPIDGWNIVLHVNTGIQITLSGKPLFREDPKRSEIALLHHDARIQHTTLQARRSILNLEDEIAKERESRQNEQKWREEARKKDFIGERRSKITFMSC